MSTSTRLKGHVGIVVAGMVLAVLAALSILAVLPGMAEAQEEAEAQEDMGPTASVEAEQNSTTDDEKGASATTRLVVEPGDSLWSISQEQIGSNATPQQVAYEVERIFELNRDRIGHDPNLIFPGQELLLEPLVKPAAPEEPVVSEEPVVFEEPVAPEEPVVSEEPVPSEEPETSTRMTSLTLAFVTLVVLLPLLIFPVYAGIAIHRRFVQPYINRFFGTATQTGEDPEGRSGPAGEGPETTRGSSSLSGTQDTEPPSAREPIDIPLAASRRQGRLRRIRQRASHRTRRPTI